MYGFVTLAWDFFPTGWYYFRLRLAAATTPTLNRKEAYSLNLNLDYAYVVL